MYFVIIPIVIKWLMMAIITFRHNKSLCHVDISPSSRLDVLLTLKTQLFNGPFRYETCRTSHCSAKNNTEWEITFNGNKEIDFKRFVGIPATSLY